jgi:hypothetical protein
MRWLGTGARVPCANLGEAGSIGATTSKLMIEFERSRHVTIKSYLDRNVLPTVTMDETPTSLFESYEQDFRRIIQNISDKLEGSGKDQRGGAFVIHFYIHVFKLMCHVSQNNVKQH